MTPSFPTRRSSDLGAVVLSAISPASEVELEAFFKTTSNGSAIVLGQGLLHEGLNKAAERWRNFVVWGARMEDQAYCSVGSDNFAGGYKAASHLVRTGHTDLLFLGDTPGKVVDSNRTIEIGRDQV